MPLGQLYFPAFFFFTTTWFGFGYVATIAGGFPVQMFDMGDFKAWLSRFYIYYVQPCARLEFCIFP